MRSSTLKATLIAVFTSTCLCIPALQAQPLNKGMPAHEDPSSPLAGMMLPPGEEPTALNLDTLKAQAIELRHSLTDQQRREIRAVLEANAPSTKGAGAGDRALQGLGQAEQEQIATINPSMWPQLSSPLEHFFLVLSLLVRIGLGCAHTGSVCE